MSFSVNSVARRNASRFFLSYILWKNIETGQWCLEFPIETSDGNTKWCHSVKSPDDLFQIAFVCADFLSQIGNTPKNAKNDFLYILEKNAEEDSETDIFKELAKYPAYFYTRFLPLPEEQKSRFLHSLRYCACTGNPRAFGNHIFWEQENEPAICLAFCQAFLTYSGISFTWNTADIPMDFLLKKILAASGMITPEKPAHLPGRDIVYADPESVNS